MRKRIIGVEPERRPGEKDVDWLDLERLATVEVTSEAPQFPIESVFGAGEGPGWRAAQSGAQRLRLVFDEPTTVRRIRLAFHEAETERTQEFVLRWTPADSEAAREIVRQQWNFSPGGATTETEDYAVELGSVKSLELEIQPDLGRGKAPASLKSWKVG